MPFVSKDLEKLSEDIINRALNRVSPASTMPGVGRNLLLEQLKEKARIKKPLRSNINRW